MTNPKIGPYIVHLNGLEDSPEGFLKDPKTSKAVEAQEYSFSAVTAEAWVFPTIKQAEGKAKLLAQHFGYPYPTGAIEIWELEKIRSNEEIFETMLAAWK